MTTTEQLVGQTIYDLMQVNKTFLDTVDLGCARNGTTDDRNALNGAGSGGRSVVMRPGNYYIGSNLTMNVPVIFEGSAVMVIPNGVTVTFMAGIIATESQHVFSCANTGQVVWGVPQQSSNVAWFGATGDGATDDSVAVQKAIDALGSAGGEVYFPKGVYNFNNTIVNFAAAPYKVRGSGKGVTVIKAKGTATSLFRFHPAIVWTDALAYATELKVHDITFQGDSATSQTLIVIDTKFVQPPKLSYRFTDCAFQFVDHTTNHTFYGVQLKNCTGVRFERCEWGPDFATGEANVYGVGVLVDGSGTSFVQHVRFSDCDWYFMSGVNAVAAYGTGDIEDLAFHNCHMVGQGLNTADPDDGRHYGVKALNITDFQWIGGESTGVTGLNFWLGGGGPFHIDHCHMTNNRHTADGTPMILVDDTDQSTIVEFSHIFSTKDLYPGDVVPFNEFSILFNPTGGHDFIGCVHDNYFGTGAGGAHAVSDPGTSITYHHNYRDAVAVLSAVP